MIDALRARLPGSPRALLSGRGRLRGTMAVQPALTGGLRAQDGSLPRHLKIRIALERTHTVSRLRALSRQPGQLSDSTRLAEAKARYRAALAATFGAAALSTAV